MTNETKVAFLGPLGTFCHEAALSQIDLAKSDLVPKRSIAEVFESVDNGDTLLGVAPLENTIEGSVSLTLDLLVFDSEAMIQREIDHNISLCLATKSDTPKEEVTTILSHPHALAQSRSYIEENFANATTKSTDSTAGAAHILSESSDRTLAAICPVEAANRYGRSILDAHIQDRDFNQTRFVVLGRGIPEPTGKDKTSIVCFQRADEPGSLLKILAEFAERNINFTKLESRPTKEGLGQYCFLMDFDGHISDNHIGQCLEKVRNDYADVKFLGSYPIAGDQAQSPSSPQTKTWKDTSTWLKDLLAKVGTI